MRLPDRPTDLPAAAHDPADRPARGLAAIMAQQAIRLTSLVIALLGGLSLAVIAVLLHDREQTRLQHQGEAIVAALKTDFETLNADLEQLARSTVVRHGLADEAWRARHVTPTLEAFLRGQRGLAAVWLADADGRTLVGSRGPSSGNGLDGTVAGLAVRSAAERSTLYLFRRDGPRPALLLAAPTSQAERGRSPAVLVAEVDLPRLIVNRLDEVREPQRAEVRHAGGVIAFSARAGSAHEQQVRWRLPLLATTASATDTVGAPTHEPPFELVLATPWVRSLGGVLLLSGVYLGLALVLLLLMRRHVRRFATRLQHTQDTLTREVDERTRELAAAKQRLDDDFARLSTVFALSPDGFVGFDGQQRVALVTPGFERLSGSAAADWLGLERADFDARFGALLAPMDPALSGHWRQAAESAGGGHAELQILRSPRRILLCSARDCDAPNVSRVVHWRDITTESEVDRMKGQFLSVAAHELRTPMTSIYGFVELLISRAMAPERQRHLLDTIHRQCEAMIAILNDVLDLARIESRRGGEFDLVEVDLVACVEESVGDFAPPPQRAGPELRAPPAAIGVSVDRGKLAQVLRNLLSNAFKYSPGGGAVTVQVGRDQHGGAPRAFVSVTDQGIGMAPEAAARAFERFFRADESGSIPGTGLGLALVREIVSQMGGDVTLVTAPGAGTRVTVWLPLVPAAAAPVALVTPAAPAALPAPTRAEVLAA